MNSSQAIFPSKHSLNAVKGIWAQLDKKERIRTILSIIFPMINQTANILTFYLIIRITITGIHGLASLEQRFIYSFCILLCVALASLIGWINNSLQAAQKATFQRLARQFFVQKYIALRHLPDQEKKPAIKQLGRMEQSYIGPLVSALQSITQMAAAFLLILSLTLAVSFVAPLISAVIGVSAVVLLLIVRGRKAPPFRPRDEIRHEAVDRMRATASGIAFSDKISREDIENYVFNDLDQMNQAADITRVNDQQKEQVLVALGSVIILTTAMNVVKPEAFADYPAAAIVAYILALRVCLQNIQQMVRHWGTIYRDRKLIFELGNGAVPHHPEGSAISRDFL